MSSLVTTALEGWTVPLLCVGLALAWSPGVQAEVVEAFVPPPALDPVQEPPAPEEEGAPGDPFLAEPSSEASSAVPVTLSLPPLLQVPPGAVMDWSSEFDRRFRFRMNMAFGAAGVTAAGILPFGVAVALHEIWPCGGRDCINVNTIMGLTGLAGLSLFLIGAGAMAHWSTVAAHALYDPKAPAGAIWMGRTAFVLWAISEILLTLAIVGPGAGLFWAGTLFGFASIPFAIGQLVSTTLRRRDRSPGTRRAGWQAGALPLARWSL